LGRGTFGEDVYWYYESDGGTTWGGGRTVYTPKTHYLVKNLERIDCESKRDALKKLKELNDAIKEILMSSRMNLCYIREDDEIELSRDLIRETKLELDNENDTNTWYQFFNDKEAKELNDEEQFDLAFVKLKRMILVLCHTDYTICSDEHNIGFLARILFGKNLILTTNDSLYNHSDEMNKYCINIGGDGSRDILVNIYKGMNYDE
jgi:hypothetical protein